MGDKLIVIDMQNDFSPSESVIKRVVEKIERYKSNRCEIYITMDSHSYDEYSLLEESKKYTPHCIVGTIGHELVSDVGSALALYRHDCKIYYKNSFGSMDLVNALLQDCCKDDKIEICGVCTDICVISNALMIRSALNKNKIYIDSSAVEGSTPEASRAALSVMERCGIIVN